MASPYTPQGVIEVRNRFGLVKAITQCLIGIGIGMGIGTAFVAMDRPVNAQPGGGQGVAAVFVLVLVAVLAVVLVVYSLGFMPVAVDFGKSIRCRSLCRSRVLDLSDVVGLWLHEDIGSIPAPIRFLFGLRGEAVVLCTDGSMIRVEVNALEFEALEPVVEMAAQLLPRQEVVATRQTLLGQIAMGCLFLLVGLYVNYLVLAGDWVRLWEPAPNQPPGPTEKVLQYSLPVALPLIGIIMCVLGLRSLRK